MSKKGGAHNRLGILAGKGEIPFIAARRALEAGEDVRIFLYADQEVPEDLRERVIPVTLTKFFTSVIKSIQGEEVKRLILLGKASRDILYKNPSFDMRTIYVLARMGNQSDYSMFSYFAEELSKKGIEILPQPTYLPNMFLAPGRYGKKCSEKELKDVEFGMFFAREINRLDIGQTIVVGEQAVLAVEAAEGTDKAILRGGECLKKNGAVVCKVGKVDHDLRFDIPVTGITTLESMSQAGCRLLSIEAGGAFVVNPKEFIKKAVSLGITVLAVEPEASDMSVLKKLNQKEVKLS